MESIDDAKIVYADGVLKGYNYHKMLADREMEKLEEAEAIMNTGGVSSVRFMEPSLAACRSHGYGNGPDILSMSEECDKHREAYEKANAYCRRIDDWRASLDEESRTIIDSYYWKAEPLWWIGDRLYMSRNSVRNRLHKILLTLPC